MTAHVEESHAHFIGRGSYAVIIENALINNVSRLVH